MAITPLEIQKMRFSQKIMGYDPTEVEGFLALVASSSRPCCGLRRSPRTSPPTPAARPS